MFILTLASLLMRALSLGTELHSLPWFSVKQIYSLAQMATTPQISHRRCFQAISNFHFCSLVWQLSEHHTHPHPRDQSMQVNNWQKYKTDQFQVETLKTCSGLTGHGSLWSEDGKYLWLRSTHSRTAFVCFATVTETTKTHKTNYKTH